MRDPEHRSSEAKLFEQPRRFQQDPEIPTHVLRDQRADCCAFYELRKIGDAKMGIWSWFVIRMGGSSPFRFMDLSIHCNAGQRQSPEVGFPRN